MIRSGVARIKRKASRRILVRTLVVGGLAGAAWLLSAPSAQAAGAAPRVEHGAGSVLAPVTGVLETAKPVLSTATGLLGGALAPATAHTATGPATAHTATGPATAHQAAPASTRVSVEQPVPTGRTTARRATSDPAAVVVASSTTANRSNSIADAAPAHQPKHAAARTADRAGVSNGTLNRSADRPGTRVSGLAGTPGLVVPLGVTRALAVPGALLTPVAQVAPPVLAPVTALLRPMTSMLRLFAAPLFRTVGVVTRTVTGVLPGPRGRPTSAVTPVVLRGVHGSVPSGTTGATAPGSATVAAPRAAHTETSTSRQHPGLPERAVPTASSRNTGEAPRLPYPAPTRGEGSASGIPASASGSPVGGGAFATVPSSVAGSMVAFQLLPKPADIAMPRHDAEAPTASPD